MQNNDTRGEIVFFIAKAIRNQIIDGIHKPGAHLREEPLAAALDVSRNSLREAFRLLEKEHLISRQRNRGVNVTTPTRETVIDLYRVRHLLEVPLLQQAHPAHPSALLMQDAVEQATQALQTNDWKTVATADLQFHRAIVGFSDSPRVLEMFDTVAGELRLAFWLVENPDAFHATFVQKNKQILTDFLEGDAHISATLLENYLLQSERYVLNHIA